MRAALDARGMGIPTRLIVAWKVRAAIMRRQWRHITAWKVGEYAQLHGASKEELSQLREEIDRRYSDASSKDGWYDRLYWKHQKETAKEMVALFIGAVLFAMMCILVLLDVIR